MHRHRRSQLAIVLTLVTVGVVGACIPVGTNCTLEARSSVTVTVVDEFEETPIADAVVEFAVDGGEPQACELGSVVGDYVCGYEIDGDFNITVAAASYNSTARTVTVGRTDDDCHVESEAITIPLLREGLEND